MKILTSGHVVGLIATLTLAVAFGIHFGRKVRSSSDFIVAGRRATVFTVMGIIMSTLVGGAATIGTAQMAFQYGLDGWWFTLGSGLGCLVLALVLASPLRRSGMETIPQFLSQVYGPTCGLAAGIFCSVAIFVHVIGQALSGAALLGEMVGLDLWASSFVTMALAVSFIFFGGVLAQGAVGVLKSVLLYASLGLSGVLAYRLSGGFSGLRQTLEPYPWFSLFGRGFLPDLAAGLSVAIGVMSTQTYLQAIFSGRDVASSRRGAILSAAIIPPIGLGGVLVGLSMRVLHPEISAASAFPFFILRYFPPLLGGVVLATLLITIISGAAGLILGIATMLTKDVYWTHINPKASDRKVLLISRLVVLVLAASCFLLTALGGSTLILQWAYLSMALRASTVFTPLLWAIWAKRLVRKTVGVAATIISPLGALAFRIFYPKGPDPLFVGLALSLGIMIVGHTVRMGSR
ncbi:MAG TPA: sodium:solute symporter family protein [Clostridia bacterium]|nr:sodium:solute symporter family protein [Clostridia bacterium]